MSAQTTDVLTSTTTMPGPQIKGAIQYISGGTLLSGFSTTLHLVSGPGPTYTNEVLLAQLSGAQAAGAQASGTWPVGQNMPNAGRPFNFQTDAVRLIQNGAFSGATASTPVIFEAGFCSATGALTDCCAELNAKLDDLLRFVSKVYQNAP